MSWHRLSLKVKNFDSNVHIDEVLQRINKKVYYVLKRNQSQDFSEF